METERPQDLIRQYVKLTLAGEQDHTRPKVAKRETFPRVDNTDDSWESDFDVGELTVRPDEDERAYNVMADPYVQGWSSGWR